ncbi:hypothetical protein ACQRBF_00085 [Peptoniphilaceae bacterium SGI.131]
MKKKNIDNKKKLLALESKINELKEEKLSIEKIILDELLEKIYNNYLELNISFKDFTTKFKFYIDKKEEQKRILTKEREKENEE